MSYLSDLRKSLSEMSEDELHDMILTLRQERRSAPAKQPKTKKAVKKPTVNIDDLTPEQQQELLKLLGG